MNRKEHYPTGEGSRDEINTAELKRALRHELLALDFNAFERCAASLLRSLGYENIHVRRDGEKGRNRDGGWDIEATLPTGLANVKTIAQIKQYDAVAVQKRYVDELRGSMLRSGAHQGLLITLSTFPQTAKEAATCGTIAPIRLIDGGEFVRLMVANGIGVTSGDDKDHVIDRGFFERLGRSGLADRSARSGHAAATSAVAPTSVTVVVVSSGKAPRIDWKGTT